MSRAAYTSQITTEYLDRSIIVNITEDINSMQFNLSIDQKHFLFRCGINAVKEQIDKILGISMNKEMNETLEQIADALPDLNHSFEIIKN
jgi:hypothetical protein